jgi:hypothetical protein
VRYGALGCYTISTDWGRADVRIAGLGVLTTEGGFQRYDVDNDLSSRVQAGLIGGWLVSVFTATESGRLGADARETPWQPNPVQQHLIWIRCVLPHQ